MIFKFLSNQIVNDFSSCLLNFQAPSNSSLCSLHAHLMSLYIFHPIFQSRFLFDTFSLALQFFEHCFLQMIAVCGRVWAGGRGREIGSFGQVQASNCVGGKDCFKPFVKISINSCSSLDAGGEVGQHQSCLNLFTSTNCHEKEALLEGKEIGPDFFFFKSQRY